MAVIPYDVTPGTPFKGMKFEAMLANLEATQKELDAIKKQLANGFSGTVLLAALSSGGTQGQLVIEGGVIKKVVDPT